MIEDWLLSAADAFYSLACAGDSTPDAWRDVVLWCALQAGKRDANTKPLQELLAENYLPEVHKKFTCIYRHISYAVSQNPHQNVLLRLMERVHLAPMGYSYDEALARELLLHDVGKRTDSHWVGIRGCGLWAQMEIKMYEPTYVDVDAEPDTKHLEQLEYLAYLDDDCICSGGSHLIALANVWRELCPADFPNRLLLIASDKYDPMFAMMSFIQLSLMGIACYTLTDLDYVANLENHNGIFAPPGSICSRAYSGQIWAERCWESVCDRLFGLM